LGDIYYVVGEFLRKLERKEKKRKEGEIMSG